MSNTVTATFKTYSAARDAVAALEAHGFSEQEMSIVISDRSAGQSFNMEETTKAPEGAAAGGVTGGVLGALAAGLTSVGTLATGGIGLLAAGPMVAAFAGAGAGATAGGLIGALIGAGIPEHEARRYEDEIREGAVLLAIEADSSDRAEKAETILLKQDAYNIAA